MTDEIRTLLARHLPGHKVRRVTGLGEGLDNAAFEGYRGKYVFHCHNLEHEDMMMMANFEVV